MEILGLLDSLESAILDSFKIPLTSKVVVQEGEILALIDKMRLVIQSGNDFVKKAIEAEHKIMEEKDGHEKQLKKISKATVQDMGEEVSAKELEEKAQEIIHQAYQLAREIRLGADKYADEILANLEINSNKILRTIKNGRLRLKKFIGSEEESKEEEVSSEEKGVMDKSSGSDNFQTQEELIR